MDISTDFSPEMQDALKEFGNHDEHEPLLQDDPEYANIWPARPEFQQFYEMLEKQNSTHWVPKEVNMTDDLEQSKTLDPKVLHFLWNILAYFLTADAQVNENLAENFVPSTKCAVLKALYDTQKAMENIHQIVYSQLFHTIVGSPIERQSLLDAALTSDFIRLKRNWTNKWIRADLPFAVKVVAFACVESLFFQGQFASVKGICNMNGSGKERILRGLDDANEFISRDEGLHVDTAVMVHSTLVKKLPEKLIAMIVRECVEIEKRALESALPESILGFNRGNLGGFIECVADKLYGDLVGGGVLYGSPNPFPFYSLVASGQVKTNFFESAANTYKREGAHLPPGFNPGSTDVAAFRKRYTK